MPDIDLERGLGRGLERGLEHRHRAVLIAEDVIRALEAM
jgi:hypothetical protein